MLNTVPDSYQEFIALKWSQLAPYFEALSQCDLTSENIEAWLADWSRLINLRREAHNRLYVAVSVNTADEAAAERLHAFLVDLAEHFDAASQTLKQKLLDSGLQPPGFDIPLRDMRAEAELFRPENAPLFTQEEALFVEYDRITGAQTVTWEGEERTIPWLSQIYQNTNRPVRQAAWTLASERALADRDALNDLWTRSMHLRRQQAANAGYSNYRDFRWKLYKRFDYTPDDCLRFHDAIEQVVVPAAQRLNERRRGQLQVETLRPWDLDVDARGRAPLAPFAGIDELITRSEAIFRQVEPDFGDYFAIMRRENLLDLDNRKGKTSGGYQLDFPASKRPFILMNAVGIHLDVQTLFHESGHAFHSFESMRLPYAQQLIRSAEIAEVASMAMELLAAPYLAADTGGFYSPADAARARIEQLERLIHFWTFMAVVDAFQHDIYMHHDEATHPAYCDAKWSELWQRFRPGEDWSGLHDAMATGWQRLIHIFQIPFYFVEYGLAQIGAVQVWRNSLHDPQQALKQYRHMLTLGGTRPLPELYAAAGANLAFDAQTLRELVDLIEQTIHVLEAD